MNLIKFNKCLGLLLTMFLVSCNSNDTLISVSNKLSTEKGFETVELTASQLKVETLEGIGLVDTESNTEVVTQLVDQDGDGNMDVLLFQPTVAANSTKQYKVISTTTLAEQAEVCYSRFVPERTDDYTWENDRVAFRVYGPTAQKMIEDNIPGGTLSSGVDAWLKRVDYPIINKWYKETTEGTGSYHEDTGEGLDNFHVGISRGVGGIAVKSDEQYYFSKNYVTWRTITTGPLRTSFELTYADWDANGNTITESKIISLDKGNFFSKFETSITGANTISAGLTLHEKDGTVTGNSEAGWVSYWQPHADTELGTAIVAEKEYFENYEEYLTDEKDLSNAYAHLNVLENKVVYYAGFGWSKAGVFTNKTDWESYLKDFSEKINNPLVVTIEN